jgi:hypothetical protein
MTLLVYALYGFFLPARKGIFKCPSKVHTVASSWTFNSLRVCMLSLTRRSSRHQLIVNIWIVPSACICYRPNYLMIRVIMHASLAIYCTVLVIKAAYLMTLTAIVLVIVMEGRKLNCWVAAYLINLAGCLSFLAMLACNHSRLIDMLAFYQSHSDCIALGTHCPIRIQVNDDNPIQFLYTIQRGHANN